MTSLLDALASEPTPRGRPCELKAWIDTLTPEEGAAVRLAIETRPPRGRSNTALAVLLTANGHEVSYSTIANHRRNTCASCRS